MDGEHYKIAAVLLPRLLGFIYFIVFASFLFQAKGLIGSKGILPVGEYLQFVASRVGKKKYYYAPTLLWINSSDTALMALVSLGATFGLLLGFGISPILLLPLLYLLHLSLLIAGQDFLSFGWETFLLEITFNTSFLVLTPTPNPFIWISLNLLLFRFYFLGGVSKLLSQDPNWKNMTALAFHYESQPLPNTQAWYAHKLPLFIQKVSTFVMFIIEIVVPFGIFATDEIRLYTFWLFLLLQFLIWFTGNFSYLNYLSVVFSIILIPDTTLSSFFTLSPSVDTPSLSLQILVSIMGALLILYQVLSLVHYFMPNQTCRKMLDPISPFCIVNRYGIFAVMTTRRDEIVIEGSDDGVTWHEYLFKYKPSEITRRPRRVAPYQPRLDWQMWFLPFTYYESEWWFQRFLYSLLIGSEDVLRLIRKNPFPSRPPKYIRASVYLYQFSNFDEKTWWKRQFERYYSPTLSLKD